MEPQDSNLRLQPTGGLKLMTVFIAVLALHVLVIGGFTVWHLLNPASIDSDLTMDKTHKGAKSAGDSALADVSAGDATATDKSGSAPAVTDSEAPAATDAVATASTASATPAATASAPATPVASSPATAPITVDPSANPTMAEDASVVAANSASNPVVSEPVHNGPVVNPPDNLAPPADKGTATVTADVPAAPAAPMDGTSYTVKRGDSLAKIARHHHVMLSDLRAANGLAGDGLHIGQKLVIPSAPKADAVATTATPAPADLTATPAAPTDADASGPVTAPAVATLALPKHTHAAHRLYTVVKGDTLTRIAKRYHTTTSAIMAANNLTNAGRLAIGQKLHIPAHESRASSTAEETTPQETEPHAAPKGQLANYTP